MFTCLCCMERPKAFLRLPQEILSKTDDDSIFAWEGHGTGGLLASSPKLFQGVGNVVMNKFDPERPPHAMTSKGLSLALTVLSPETSSVCTEEKSNQEY